MKEVVIAGYLRTAQTRSRPNDPPRDWFFKMRPDTLLAKLTPELVKRVGSKPGEIEDFVQAEPGPLGVYSISQTSIEYDAVGSIVQLVPSVRKRRSPTSMQVWPAVPDNGRENPFMGAEMGEWPTF